MDRPDPRITKLRASLERGGTHDLEDVVEAIRRGDMQAFTNDDSIIVTEIAETPRERILFVFLAAGTLSGCIDLQAKVHDFCIENGIRRVRSHVRPGFARILNKHGWRSRTIGVEYIIGD